jgi:hypothetical protein
MKPQEKTISTTVDLETFEKMNPTIVIEISTLAQPLSEQLKGLLDVDQINLFDADAKAIERLHVRGLITDLNYTLIRKKLCRQISNAISRYAGCDGLEIVDAIDEGKTH